MSTQFCKAYCKACQCKGCQCKSCQCKSCQCNASPVNARHFTANWIWFTKLLIQISNQKIGLCWFQRPVLRGQIIIYSDITYFWIVREKVTCVKSEYSKESYGHFPISLTRLHSLKFCHILGNLLHDFTNQIRLLNIDSWKWETPTTKLQL